ncbi:hypothetical protein ACHQM5_006901 [Ranunculus cassubicifolius]
MATVKADRPVGSQVLGQIKKAPAESGGSLKAPASKTDPKKEAKGGRPVRQRKSLNDESINKQLAVTKDVATKVVKAARKPQKKAIDDESTKGDCITKQQPVAKDMTVKGGKPARKPRRGSLDDESLTGENP